MAVFIATSRNKHARVDNSRMRKGTIVSDRDLHMTHGLHSPYSMLELAWGLG